ncbi:MAG: septum formation initiator family protein [Opitutales bacterium]
MKSIAFYKILVGGLAVLLVLTAMLSATLILQARRELDYLRREEQGVRDQLKQVQLQLDQRQEALDRLENDPAYLEREVRERLGYAKPNELIYRFDVDPLTANPLPGYSPSPNTPASTKSSKSSSSNKTSASGNRPLQHPTAP